MYLCDIGNTNATINHNGKIWSLPISQFQYFDKNEKIYYINVNENLQDKLQVKENFINLESYFELDTIYEGIGIDRIAACCAINDGLIVDAGSAITIDIMSNSVHLGGFILPGIKASLDCFRAISTKLKANLKTSVDLNMLPQNTNDAINYGILKPIVKLIEENCKDKKIYFTGGDGAFLSRFFPQSVYRQDLIFNSMKKVIQDNKL